jgi:hypothetical protein
MSKRTVRQDRAFVLVSETGRKIQRFLFGLIPIREEEFA